MNTLWAAKLDWNGVPASNNFSQDPNTKPRGEQKCFRKYAKRLVMAWEDMKFVGPIPMDALEGVDTHLSAARSTRRWRS